MRLELHLQLARRHWILNRITCCSLEPEDIHFLWLFLDFGLIFVISLLVSDISEIARQSSRRVVVRTHESYYVVQWGYSRPTALLVKLK
jgi:hypothetical protein